MLAHTHTNTYISMRENRDSDAYSKWEFLERTDRRKLGALAERELGFHVPPSASETASLSLILLFLLPLSPICFLQVKKPLTDAHQSSPSISQHSRHVLLHCILQLDICCIPLLHSSPFGYHGYGGTRQLLQWTKP